MAVIVICAVIFILLKTSYVSRTRKLSLFVNIIVALQIASIMNIVFQAMLEYYNPGLSKWVYVVYLFTHFFLFDLFCLFVLYIAEVSGMAHWQARIAICVATGLMFGLILLDVLLTVFGVGFRIGDDGSILYETRVFKIGYLLFMVMVGVLLLRVRRLVFKRVLFGFYAVIIISIAVRFGQQALMSQVHQGSLTMMTFVFPIIAMLYLIHSNPYNVTLGSLDMRGLEDMIKNMYDHKEPFVFMVLLLPEYDAEGREIPKEIQEPIRRASSNYFKNSFVFQIGNAHMVQVIPKRKNKDYEHRIDQILGFFQAQYSIHRISYKIVIGESIDAISERNEYVSLIQSVERSMAVNSICRIGDDEIERFNYDDYVLKELMDIYNNKDLNDPRVLAFCQPVFNLRTGQFDTAEALMRLKLEETGIVPPNQFIPIAENHGYIHVLTEIILNKTSQEIKKLMEEGFLINRISVNVSAVELKDDRFCRDIMGIIERNGISGDKIALEITESSCEADFVVMNKKVVELREKGIQFYLDDFGTGYSNMERIMEIPFDIIKFDRSLVIASESDERSEKIVKNLAHMFKDMDYSILYEGVENAGDEERCRGMFASYLQGFKYSRPIPIVQLREFLKREEVAA